MTLFDHLARDTDPETSKQAAIEIVPHLGKLHQWAIECVTATPGLTQMELGRKHCPDDLRRIGRRLDACDKAGKLKRGLTRICTITGKRAQTWWPIEEDSHA